MKTRKSKSLVIYGLMFLAVVLISVSATLALITDKNVKDSQSILFDKVSICGDSEDDTGSKLSLKLDNLVGNGEVIFDTTVNENHYLLVRPTNDTADCFIRFKVYYSLGNENLDLTYKSTLDLLNASEYIKNGFVPYNNEGNDYGFTYLDGYYYLVTAPSGNETLLKVADSEDNASGFRLSEKMVMHLAPENENAVVEMLKENSLYLNVKVEAVQAFGITNIEAEEVPFGNEQILNSSNELIESKEDLYGNVNIYKARQAFFEDMGYLEMTVKFDKNLAGASGTIADMTLIYGQTITLPNTNAFVSSDYYFSNWKVKGNNKIYSGEMTYLQLFELSKGANEVVFYPNWQPKVFEFKSISFSSDTKSINTYGTWTVSKQINSIKYLRTSTTVTLTGPAGYESCPQYFSFSVQMIGVSVRGYNSKTGWESLGYESNPERKQQSIRVTSSKTNYYTKFEFTFRNAETDPYSAAEGYAYSMGVYGGTIRKIV